MHEIITNGTEIKQRILNEINNAQESVYVAMAWFTDRDIANAIINCKNRFSRIDIILSSNVQNETVKEMLRGAGISVHAFETGDSRGIMHHKFCLIDNKITINGSYNYSYNASSNNVENIHISDDLSIYTQLYSEFEKLRYNIDNKIAVNTTIQQEPVKKVEEPKPKNIIDSFAEQLHNLVYSAVQIDTEEYQRKGFEVSKESLGNLDIFRVEYDNIKEKIRAYSTDEGLGSKKNILTSNITRAYESFKNNLEVDKSEKVLIANRNAELNSKQINDKISQLKQDKLILESGNQNSGEKGLLQLNKELEKNKLEKKLIEETLILKEFWTPGNIFLSIILGIIFFYLSFFFASALFKILFEGDIIKAALRAGIDPGKPKLFDANAIVKIYKQEGAIFAFIGIIFFLFPVLFSNIKLIGSRNKYLNLTFMVIGLVVFDIMVSGMIATISDEIKCLLEGKKSQMNPLEVVFEIEFWSLLLFGMMPLVITHFLLEFLHNAYVNSKQELLSAEKNKKIIEFSLEEVGLNSDKEFLKSKIKLFEDDIASKLNELSKVETDLQTEITSIENKYSEVIRQIKAIFDDFIGRITSGKIFTDVVFETVIAAFKAGYVEFLPTYYSSSEVATRVPEIEKIVASQ